MRAVIADGAGGPEVLSVGEVPDPEPGPDEVVLDVVAAGLNRADLLQRQGFYPPPPGTSDVIGMECSGTVAAVGDGVEGWSVGDAACALLAGGGYAAKVAVPAGQLMPVPDGVDLVTAAALPEVACTVWSNVFMVAGLQPQETLLVHGGAGGIGTFAIQLAHQLGSQVLTTAGTPEKPRVLAFEDRAVEVFDGCLERLHGETLQAQGLLAGWLGKGRGTVARLAAVLALLDWTANRPTNAPPPTVITAQHLHAAWDLWDRYYRPHASAVFD